MRFLHLFFRTFFRICWLSLFTLPVEIFKSLRSLCAYCSRWLFLKNNSFESSQCVASPSPQASPRPIRIRALVTRSVFSAHATNCYHFIFTTVILKGSTSLRGHVNGSRECASPSTTFMLVCPLPRSSYDFCAFPRRLLSKFCFRCTMPQAASVFYS
jgi:hypothetical protein